jgi:hypothetical protein
VVAESDDLVVEEMVDVVILVDEFDVGVLIVQEVANTVMLVEELNVVFAVVAEEVEFEFVVVLVEVSCIVVVVVVEDVWDAAEVVSESDILVGVVEEVADAVTLVDELDIVVVAAVGEILNFVVAVLGDIVVLVEVSNNVADEEAGEVVVLFEELNIVVVEAIEELDIVVVEKNSVLFACLMGFVVVVVVAVVEMSLKLNIALVVVVSRVPTFVSEVGVVGRVVVEMAAETNIAVGNSETNVAVVEANIAAVVLMCIHLVVAVVSCVETCVVVVFVAVTNLETFVERMHPYFCSTDAKDDSLANGEDAVGHIQSVVDVDAVQDNADVAVALIEEFVDKESGLRAVVVVAVVFEKQDMLETTY